MPVEKDPRRRLLHRHRDNPILTAGNWPYPINSVFNAGATRLRSGETLLLCRAEDCSGRSHLCAARSADGVRDWSIDAQPTMWPDADSHPEEVWGLEDPRVVRLPELDRYAVVYTSWAKAGPGVSLALTQDFRSFQRLGFVLPPENKDATLLPRRIGDRWAMIHRPRAAGQPAHIWIAYSPDLRHWGDHAVLMPAKRGPWWDANKIGLSTPLIETDQGWLMIYHGVKTTVAGAIYRLGLALLDLEDPRRVLLRGNQWIFGPEADYELTGDVANITFPCGYTLGDDGDTLSLYYGAADTSIALATGSIGEMLDWLRTNSETDPAAL